MIDPIRATKARTIWYLNGLLSFIDALKASDDPAHNALLIGIMQSIIVKWRWELSPGRQRESLENELQAIWAEPPAKIDLAGQRVISEEK